MERSHQCTFLNIKETFGFNNPNPVEKVPANGIIVLTEKAKLEVQFREGRRGRYRKILTKNNNNGNKGN